MQIDGLLFIIAAELYTSYNLAVRNPHYQRDQPAGELLEGPQEAASSISAELQRIREPS